MFVVQTYRDHYQNSLLTGQHPLQELKEVMKVCSWVAVYMDVLIVKGITLLKFESPQITIGLLA